MPKYLMRIFAPVSHLYIKIHTMAPHKIVDEDDIYFTTHTIVDYLPVLTESNNFALRSQVILCLEGMGVKRYFEKNNEIKQKSKKKLTFTENSLN